MARKRMFDLEIINQDSFLDLPMEAKALYFLLGMNADDEGFVAPKKILRLYGGTEDSLKMLILKNFIIPFKTGVIVIVDWNSNNWLDNRRVKPTIYQEEKQMLICDKTSKKYMLEPNAKQLLRENRGEEIRLEENRVEEDKEEIKTIATHSQDTIFDYIEDNFGRTLTSIDYELINTWEDNELTRYAIKTAILNNVRNLKYIDSILRRYKTENIKTVEEAKESEKRFKDKNKNYVNEESKEWI